jgi:dTDP-4-amino-4,6-dideoxygalactose transaminase
LAFRSRSGREGRTSAAACSCSSGNAASDSRLLLAGNLTRQPGYLGLDHRIAGDLAATDRITEAAVWVGTYPGLSDVMVDWIVESIIDFMSQR